MEIEDEVREILQGEMQKIPPVVFPDVQRVEVVNFPEQIAPIVNVQPPEVRVTVPEPRVTVSAPVIHVEKPDLSEIAQGLRTLSEKMTQIIEKESPFFDYERFEDIAKAHKPTFVGGGSSWLPVVDSVEKQNYLSFNNSTTTLLVSGATFTGAWEDVTKYNSLTIAVKTDQNGTYTVQFSPDGVNADSTLTRYYRTTQIEAPHRFTITRRYVRVTFTNTSASDQTYLRLQVLLGDKADLNIPTDSMMAQDFDALSVRPSEFKYEVALGRRQGFTTWNKFGYNADIDTGTETVWGYGGTWARMTVADTLSIVSSSVNDDGSPAGTGAQTVTLYGVDANYLYQTETVTLNGTTPVVTTGQWLGINRAIASLCGSGETNAGNITITRTTGGSVQGYIPTGEGTTQQSIFFSQADHVLLMDFLNINCEKTAGGSTPKVTIKGWVYSAVTNTKTLIFRQLMDTAVENGVMFNINHPFIIGEKSIMYFEATTDTDNSVVAVRFSLIEVRDIDA